jgi:hypothetical protein
MLSDIILNLLDPDMELVASLPDREGILKYLDESSADVVILGLDDARLPDDSVAVFGAHPKIKVLGVVGRGRMVYLHELRPSMSTLGEVSAEELLEVIRRAVPG